jgi:hypothetical protein
MKTKNIILMMCTVGSIWANDHRDNRYLTCCTPVNTPIQEEINWDLAERKDDQSNRSTPSPTSPLTPTTWEGLQTTLITAPYYTQAPKYYCYGAGSIPVFVNYLKAIEAGETSKGKILEHQMAFITSTWLTWDIWKGEVTTSNHRRYPLIYKFIYNRSTTTTSSWSKWCVCWPFLSDLA